MTDIDPAAVMAKHAPGRRHWCSGHWYDPKHVACEPYRLAEALINERAAFLAATRADDELADELAAERERLAEALAAEQAKLAQVEKERDAWQESGLRMNATRAEENLVALKRAEKAEAAVERIAMEVRWHRYFVWIRTLRAALADQPEQAT